MDTVRNVTHPTSVDSPVITTVGEYGGGPIARISATQLGAEYTSRQAKKIVDEWCDFFASGPTPISKLAFTSRTPKRLFASLTGQTQLTLLAVKWGDYIDLTPVGQMTCLRDLFLGGASSVQTLAPLARLRKLESLAIEDLR